MIRMFVHAMATNRYHYTLSGMFLPEEKLRHLNITTCKALGKRGYTPNLEIKLEKFHLLVP